MFLFQVPGKLLTTSSSRDKADDGVAEQGLELELTSSTTSKHEDKPAVFEEPRNGQEGTTLDLSEAKNDRKLYSMFLDGIVVEQPDPSETSHEEYALYLCGRQKCPRGGKGHTGCKRFFIHKQCQQYSRVKTLQRSRAHECKFYQIRGHRKRREQDQGRKCSAWENFDKTLVVSNF